MKDRIFPGILLAISWLLLLLYGSLPLFSLVITATLFFAADEFVRIVRQGENTVTFLHRIFFNLALLLPVMGAALFQKGSAMVAAAFVGFSLLTCGHIKSFAKNGAEHGEADYLGYVKDIFGLFYIGVLGAHICLLRVLPEGTAWIFVATAITAGSDTGAYFSGRHFGRRKLCPAVSPKKTIEGAVGGICSAIIAALLAGYCFLEVFQPFFLIVIAVSLSLLGVIGDLMESVIKRGEGVKDSGSCLGGHGGILDRIDSLLFAIPALYYILLFLNSV